MQLCSIYTNKNTKIRNDNNREIKIIQSYNSYATVCTLLLIVNSVSVHSIVNKPI